MQASERLRQELQSSSPQRWGVPGDLGFLQIQAMKLSIQGFLVSFVAFDFLLMCIRKPLFVPCRNLSRATQSCLVNTRALRFSGRGA